jgi:type IV pilus assembly protein PilP
MKRSSTVTCFIIVLVSLVWGLPAQIGGADNKPPGIKVLDSKAAGIKPAEAKAVEQKNAEAKSASPPYKYNPIGKPDPFKSFVDEDLNREARKKREETTRASRFLSPLQRENIDQFKLVGIAGDEKGRKAVVQDLKGKVYPIFIGTYIGPNNGKVVEILADHVVIEEKFKASAGKTKSNRITMKLRKEEGE